MSKQRDELLSLIKEKPGVWFEVFYRLRWLDTGEMEFDSLSAVPETQSNVAIPEDK